MESLTELIKKAFLDALTRITAMSIVGSVVLAILNLFTSETSGVDKALGITLEILAWSMICWLLMIIGIFDKHASGRGDKTMSKTMLAIIAFFIAGWTAFFLTYHTQYTGSELIHTYWPWSCLIVVVAVFIKVMIVIRKDMIEHTKDWTDHKDI